VQIESLLAANPGGREARALLAQDWKATLWRLCGTLSMHGASTGTPFADDAQATPSPSRQAPLVPAAREAPTLASAGNRSTDEIVGSLCQQAQAALSRITCHQLASLDVQGRMTLPLTFELPYRATGGAGLLRLRVERDDHSGLQGAAGAAWTLAFALDLGPLGALRGRVTLAGMKVSVLLHPGSGVLARAIDEHLPDLYAGLQRAGFAVNTLRCLRSDPVESTPPAAWLVDLRA
jgi:hypothetical protein